MKLLQSAIYEMGEICHVLMEWNAFLRLKSDFCEAPYFAMFFWNFLRSLISVSDIFHIYRLVETRIFLFWNEFNYLLKIIETCLSFNWNAWNQLLQMSEICCFKWVKSVFKWVKKVLFECYFLMCEISF